MAADDKDKRADEKRYDAVVIGGGAAGLSGAVTLARARRSVLVIDAGQPRNAPAEGVHGYLGLDGVAPGALLARGRAEVTGYGGEVVEGRAVAARRLPEGGFEVTLADGSAVAARRLLVATGLVDELPEVPGLAALWGRGVVHCPYCHGWEVRDQPIGVLAAGPTDLAVHQALLWRQWSERVTLFLHTAADPGEEEWRDLAARGIAVVDGRVTGLVTETGEDGRERLAGVRIAAADGGGRTVPCRALATGTRLRARSEVLEELGLATEEQRVAGHSVGSFIPADATGATAVPGVWVAGNVTDVLAQVVGAAAAGVRAAAMLNADLVTEDVRQAAAGREPVRAG